MKGRKGGLRCPACGSADVIPILHGLPDHDMFQAAERGEIAIGGCVIHSSSPTDVCRACDTEFGSFADHPARLKGLGAYFPGDPEPEPGKGGVR